MMINNDVQIKHTCELPAIQFSKVARKPKYFAYHRCCGSCIFLDIDFSIQTTIFLDMDAHKETWSITYSIRLLSKDMNSINRRGYYPKTDKVQIVERDICVISPFVRTLLPLRPSDSISKFRSYEFHYLHHVTSFHIPNFLRRLENPKYFVYHRCCGSCIIFQTWISAYKPFAERGLRYQYLL